MPLIQNPLNFNCLPATGIKAATQCREGLQDREMNRIGRRVIFALLQGSPLVSQSFISSGPVAGSRINPQRRHSA
jgi:hypothetical protein